MKCYYSNRDCEYCNQKRRCDIVKEIERLERELEQAEMRLEYPPEL